MLKPENKFRVWFTERFKAHLLLHHPGMTYRVQKHADYATSGIPDLDIIICGITMWVECKLVPKITKKRTLDVSELQLFQLRDIAEAGAPAGLLVGLPLGPRKGYLAAWFSAGTIPSHITRDAFRQPETIYRQLITESEYAAEKSLARIKASLLTHPIRITDPLAYVPGLERVGDHGC